MLYIDTSALIKFYLQEAGTDAIKRKIKVEYAGGQRVFISDLGYAEIFAVLARKLRENLLQQAEFDALETQFLDDWLFTLDRIELATGVLGFLPDLLKRHPLKGADAIHLASALWLRDALRLGKFHGAGQGMLQFATADKQLKNAASQLGFPVFDPENPI